MLIIVYSTFTIYDDDVMFGYLFNNLIGLADLVFICIGHRNCWLYVLYWKINKQDIIETGQRDPKLSKK